jgi:hypothetical protein
MIYGCNDHLRRRGVTPTPFGQAPLRDALKYHAFRTVSTVKSLLTGSKRDDTAY